MRATRGIAWGRVGETPRVWQRADREDVVQARDGCHDAFARLYEGLGGRVRVTARRFLRDSHAAEDAVQDTFLAAYRGLPALSDPGAFDAWLLRIARNTAVDHARRASRCQPSERAHDESTDDLPGHPRVVRRSGTREPAPIAGVLLRTAFADLPPALQETLRLRYVRGLSCADVARELGVSLNCVKTRVHRARKVLRGAARAASE